jgi:hypothetical protein
MLGGFVGGRLNRRLAICGLLRTGSAVIVVAAASGFLLALRVPPGFLVVVLPVFAYMFGAGLVLPAAMAGAIGPFPERAGTASALLGFIQLLVAASMGVLVAALYDGTARPMTGVLALAALATLIASFTAARPRATPR